MIRQSLTSWKTITEQLLRILHVMEEEKRDIVIEQIETLLKRARSTSNIYSCTIYRRRKIIWPSVAPIRRRVRQSTKTV